MISEFSRKKKLRTRYQVCSLIMPDTFKCYNCLHQPGNCSCLQFSKIIFTGEFPCTPRQFQEQSYNIALQAQFDIPKGKKSSKVTPLGFFSVGLMNTTSPNNATPMNRMWTEVNRPSGCYWNITNIWIQCGKLSPQAISKEKFSRYNLGSTVQSERVPLLFKKRYLASANCS